MTATASQSRSASGRGATCLVLGGRGFVGSAVAAEAAARGYAVRIVEKDDYEAHVGAQADVLINADGNSRKYLAVQDPALEFDLSVRSVQRSLVDFRAERYVFLSTVDVYPNVSDPSANDETAPVDPFRLSPYGFHKYLAEQLVRFRAPSWLILRMGGFVGPGLWKNSVYDLLKGRPLRVHPDSEYQYLHTRELARIALDLVEARADKEIFNVAGDGTVSLRQVAALIPGCDLSRAPSDLPRERYEVSLAKIKKLTRVPPTWETVRAFVQDVLQGKESLR